MKLIERYTREEFLSYFKKYRSNNSVAKNLGISVPSVKRIKKEFNISQKDYDYFHIGKPAWNSGNGHTSLCEICGIIIKASPKKNRRFCSRKCTHVWFSSEYLGDKFKGTNNPNWNNGEVLKETYRKGLVKKKPFNGKEYTKGRRTLYNGINFRSTWEAEFAKELDENSIKWEYETKHFNLSNGKHYMPDFYIPEENKFYEVKGYWWPSAKEKFDLFKEEYPNINIEIKGQEWWNERQK